MKITGFYKVEFKIGQWDDFKQINGITFYIRKYANGFHYSFDSGNYTFIFYNQTKLTENQLLKVVI